MPCLKTTFRRADSTIAKAYDPTCGYITESIWHIIADSQMYSRRPKTIPAHDHPYYYSTTTVQTVITTGSTIWFLPPWLFVGLVTGGTMPVLGTDCIELNSITCISVMIRDRWDGNNRPMSLIEKGNWFRSTFLRQRCCVT